MPSRPQTLIGLLLIAAGIVFFLDAADIVSIGELISDWWPLVLVGVGLVAMFGRAGSRTGGGLLIIIGGVLLLATTGVIDVAIWQLIIALLLIAGGVSLVLRGLRGDGESSRENDMTISVILSEQRVVSHAAQLRRASVTAILGELRVDLRNARVDPDGATVDTFCLLGEINIIVPRAWYVTVNGMPALGEFSDQTDREFERAPDAPRLAVTGVAMLAEVKVRHDA